MGPCYASGFMMWIPDLLEAGLSPPKLISYGSPNGLQLGVMLPVPSSLLGQLNSHHYLDLNQQPEGPDPQWS